MVRQRHRTTVKRNVMERALLLVLLALLLAGAFYTSFEGITGAAVGDMLSLTGEERNRLGDEFGMDNKTSGLDAGEIGLPVVNESEELVPETLENSSLDAPAPSDFPSIIEQKEEEIQQEKIQQDLPVITEAEGSPSGFGIQAAANSTACGTVNSNLTLTSDVYNRSTCFTINMTRFILDCAGFGIYFGDNQTGSGISFSRITSLAIIQNCLIKKGGTNGSSNIGIDSTPVPAKGIQIINTTIIINGSGGNNKGIYFPSGADSNMIVNTTIIVTNGSGITISSAKNNVTNTLIMLDGNGTSGTNWHGIITNANTIVRNVTILIDGSENDGIIISGIGNIIDNNTINISTPSNSIPISFGTSSRATLINNILFTRNQTVATISPGSAAVATIVYNNSFGQIIWNTTTPSTSVNISLSESIVLQNNTIGIVGNRTLLGNLTKAASIEIRQLPYNFTPTLLKDGIPCQQTDACNISYDSATFILSANISGFSNYSTKADNITPSITLLTPDNNTINTTALYFSFSFNATDNLFPEFSYCDLWINNTATKNASRYGSNSSVKNASLTTLTSNVSLSDGRYFWWINCSDSIDSNISVQNNFTVDYPHERAPFISLEAPINNTMNNTHKTFNFTFNATDDLLFQDFLNCTLWLNKTAAGTPVHYGDNFSVKNATTTIIANNASLSSVSYYWWVNCSNGVDRNVSASYIINLTNNAPNVTLLSPANDTNTTNGSIKFVFTASDDSSSTLNCTVWLNNSSKSIQNYSTDSSVINGSTTTLVTSKIISSSKYWWWVSCYDGVDASNSTQMNLTVKNCYPITENTTLSGETIIAGSTGDTCFSFTKNNTILDGNGTTIIFGSGQNPLIKAIALNARNITVKNFNIHHFPVGIHNQNNGTVVNVTVYNASIGMLISSAVGMSEFANITIDTTGTGINSSSNNQLFQGITISNYSVQGVLLQSTQSNNFSNIRINGETGSFIALSCSSSTCYNYLTNFTGNLTVGDIDSNNRVYVRWPVIINVSNESGELISDAVVKVYDNNGVLEQVVVTTGTSVLNLPLAEYYLSGITTEYVAQDSSIIISKSGYTENTTSLTLLNISPTDAVKIKFRFSIPVFDRWREHSFDQLIICS